MTGPPLDSLDSIVVAGAGQAAAVAARTLRRSGFDGRLVLVGEEPDRPYQRPPLSKEYLAGDDERELLDLLTGRWCADNSVEIRLATRVTAVRAAERVVEMSDGSALRAGALLIATGGRARRLPGVSGDRVRHLRTAADCDRLRPLLRPGAHVIVVGAGFIGCEVASTARARGARVTYSNAPAGRSRTRSATGWARSAARCSAGTASSCVPARPWRPITRPRARRSCGLAAGTRSRGTRSSSPSG